LLKVDGGSAAAIGFALYFILIVEPDKLAALEHKLAPSIRFVIKALFDKEATRRKHNP
jgi:hypothetical protein